MSPRFEKPDATPPFLSADAIQGWITAAVAEERETAHAAEIARIHQMHAVEMKLQQLAGDGQGDVGSVGRLTEMMRSFVEEQKKANEKAEQQRTAQGRQLGKIRQIPEIIRDLWKTVVAIIGGVLLVMSLWGRLHPSVPSDPTQQIKRIP